MKMMMKNLVLLLICGCWMVAGAGCKSGDRDRADEFIKMGNKEIELENTRESIGFFDKAVQAAPDYARAYSMRGLAKLNIEDYPGALDDCDRAIKLDPKMAAGYFGRSVAELMMNDSTICLDDLDIAINMDPGYARAYTLRGVLKIKMGKQDGCTDLGKGDQLGDKTAGVFIQHFCK